MLRITVLVVVAAGSSARGRVYAVQLRGTCPLLSSYILWRISRYTRSLKYRTDMNGGRCLQMQPYGIAPVCFFCAISQALTPAGMQALLRATKVVTFNTLQATLSSQVAGKPPAFPWPEPVDTWTDIMWRVSHAGGSIAHSQCCQQGTWGDRYHVLFKRPATEAAHAPSYLRTAT